MGNFSSMAISGSGLSAQRQRMDVIAANIANANVTRTADGSPYRRLETVFAAKLEDASTGQKALTGVEVSQIAPDPTPFQQVYDPGHPDADANGYVSMPNVNIVQEMTDMISATRAYEANVTAMNAAKSMAMKALEIGKG